ncbi:MAG TPA: bifunctional serine/threonine-protein kinase/formylglycine-generating enzyme family protein [Kofleriaceae bacterium]|nr:bifunctional serine/threonine-protein kinase/formylglycine-generating enzyme family protein [Kofleriaceae bacterium]
MDVVPHDSAAPGPGEGAALLVAGSDPDRPVRARALTHAIGQLDQTLRSTQSRWAIRRLTPAGDERMAPTRVGIKQALEAIGRQSSDVVIVVIAGTVTSAAGEPALVTGATYRAYHEEATLPLGWIGQRLAAIAGPELVVLVSARPDEVAPPVEAWLAALAPPSTGHTVFLEHSEHAAAVEALSLGFRGAAVDPETGTVTLRSVTDYLARAAPGTRARADRRPHTIIRPASLDDLRALGWSRPADLAADLAADSADDLSCAVLRGEIRVDEELARGSFGVVYRARQLWMRRDVALKVLPPGVDARSEDGQLFLDEIRAVARIDHPNVVRIYHADETYDGRLFFAMELLTGEDLDQLADHGPVPPPRAIALVLQLLSGLAAAHETGLIHADIKPGNAFLARAGAEERVVLLDFGLARLARPGTTTESAGGTPQYMAPEQLTQGRVDERSDVFSAGLVLFTLLTGWRRQRAKDLVPPLERITDEPLRAVLSRALALDPAARYGRAADFAAALAGLGDAPSGGAGAAPAPAPGGPGGPGGPEVAAGSEPEPVQPPPFRRLRPFSERDRDRFFGRDREVAHLLDHVLQLPAVIYAAPSGVGKTSLLRAGLLPRLEALGGQGIYVACHAGTADPSAAIAAALGGGGTSLTEAWAFSMPRSAGRRVLVVDQIEAVLARDEAATDQLLAALLGGGAAEDTRAHARDQAVVIAVREDFLGRLVDRLQPHAPNLPILRLPPLTPAGARDALVRPLAARRLEIDDDLLAQLVSDLTAAAATLGAEMGWGATPAVYPPHLQLAGARLHETLPEDERVLTLRQYQHLGGIDEIVRSHLTHVLESELARDQVPIARELFKHLITPAQTRAAPTEAELIATVADPARAEATTAVLEALRHHGLVVRLARGHREASWELIHDSLIPRIQAWMDEHDLERRRVLEVLRHHARQSRPEAPSLLTARELRALRAVPDAIDIVEREWRERAALATSADGPLWTPARLVAHARAVHRRRRLIAGAVITSVAAGLTVAGASWWIGRQAQRHKEAQIAANLGRFQLELAPFDWDAEQLVARPVPIVELPELRWELREPDPADLDRESDQRLAEVTVRSSELGAGGRTRIDTVEAPGRAAFLVIEGRGRGGARCPPSILPIRALPGYALRGEQQLLLHVAVPTCHATADRMIEIPAGPFLSGGPGEPPSSYAEKFGLRAVTTYLDRYAIDPTEVTNAAYQVFSAMSALTGIAPVAYPNTDELLNASEPRYPASGMPWLDARAYCRYMGKDLPDSNQWEKALRGGLTLASGARNPAPNRNFPWEMPRSGALAKLKDVSPAGPAPVGTFPHDVSPEGVFDLAGNVSEWTLSIPTNGNSAFRVIRGGNWEQIDHKNLVIFMVKNTRPRNAIWFSIGFRCVSAPEPPPPLVPLEPPRPAGA